MEDKKLYKLKVEAQFKSLILPLKKYEYQQLELSIIEEGCREPIIVWNGYIVDGHNRYEICTKHQIPFNIIKKDFECKEAVIAWICSSQLAKGNITEETRKFLIGKLYDAEKVVASVNKTFGAIQNPEESIGYVPTNSDDTKLLVEYRHKTATRIANEYNISRGTVEKYAIYARAIETIGKKEPSIIPNILMGKYKISHNKILELSNLTPNEIKKVSRRIERSRMPFVQYKTTRKEINASDGAENSANKNPIQSIKDMPQFDPDSEIIALSLTVPTWTGSIIRVKNNMDVMKVSGGAKVKLAKALIGLDDEVQSMLFALKED